MKNVKTVILCGSDDCCPIVTVSKQDIVITDDFGGRVTLTQPQFEIFKKKVALGEL